MVHHGEAAVRPESRVSHRFKEQRQNLFAVKIALGRQGDVHREELLLRSVISGFAAKLGHWMSLDVASRCLHKAT